MNAARHRGLMAGRQASLNDYQIHGDDADTLAGNRNEEGRGGWGREGEEWASDRRENGPSRRRGTSELRARSLAYARSLNPWWGGLGGG